MPLGEGGPHERGGEKGANASLTRRHSKRNSTAFARWRHATNSLCDRDGDFSICIL